MQFSPISKLAYSFIRMKVSLITCKFLERPQKRRKKKKKRGSSPAVATDFHSNIQQATAQTEEEQQFH